MNFSTREFTLLRTVQLGAADFPPRGYPTRARQPDSLDFAEHQLDSKDRPKQAPFACLWKHNLALLALLGADEACPEFHPDLHGNHPTLAAVVLASPPARQFETPLEAVEGSNLSLATNFLFNIQLR